MVRSLCVIDDLGELSSNKHNNSLHLMLGAQKFEVELYVCAVSDLYIQNNLVLAKCRSIYFKSDNIKDYILGIFNIVEVKMMNYVLMRHNPPFDSKYITVCYILELIKHDVLIINDPRSVMNYPEKFLPLYFNEYTVPTLITADYAVAKEFLELKSKIVMKPLYSFASDGVFYVVKNDINFDVIFDLLSKTCNGHIILQEFIPGIVKGDKRVIMLDGNILFVYSRIPTDYSIRSAYAINSNLAATELDKREEKICKIVGGFLKEKGLYLSALDMIDGFITEVNVTSISGFVESYSIYGVDYTKLFWEYIYEYSK